MPAPTPQAVRSRRSAGASRTRQASALAIAAPVCFGAASRPSEAPIATMMIDSATRPIVDATGALPPENTFGCGGPAMRLPARLRSPQSPAAGPKPPI